MRPIVTVSAAASSRRLVTIDYVRTMLGLSASDATDQVIDDIIVGASAFVESWCNRKLMAETVSEVWRLGYISTPTLFLTRWPIAAIVSVTEDSSALTTAYWELDYDSGELSRLDGDDCPQPWCAGKVTIVYTAGYVPADETGADVPSDLRDGTMALVRGAWFARQRDPYLRSEEVPGVASYGYGYGAAAQSGSGVAPEVEALLAKYRMPAVG